MSNSKYTSVYNLLDVQGSGEESEDSQSQPDVASSNTLSPEAPLSKKQRARRRAQERKASKALTPKTSTSDLKKVNGKLDEKPSKSEQQTQPVQNDARALQERAQSAAVDTVDEPVQASTPNVQIPAVSVSQSEAKSEPVNSIETPEMSRSTSRTEGSIVEQVTEAEEEVEEEESSSEDEEDNVEKVHEGEAEAEAETGKREADTSKIENMNIMPHGADHAAATKYKAIVTRTTWTFAMFFGFVAIMLMGHIYIIIGVLFLQATVFRELVGLFDAGWRSMTRQPAKKASGRKDEEKDTYSKTLSWYFFAASNYFLYGESIIYYFKVSSPLFMVSPFS